MWAGGAEALQTGVLGPSSWAVGEREVKPALGQCFFTVWRWHFFWGWTPDDFLPLSHPIPPPRKNGWEGQASPSVVLALCPGTVVYWKLSFSFLGG